ncbi:hypothetical protein ACLMJK_001936 [Lecanora helva]
MLINQHHSGGKIPSNLLDTYVRYKQDTRAIVAWLLSHGTAKYKRLKEVSIRDLVSLAGIVQKKAVIMPATVDFHFREAIAARKVSSTMRVVGAPPAPSSPNSSGRATLQVESIRRIATMNFSPKGRNMAKGFKTAVTDIPSHYSLSQIYSGLCKCCVKPKDICKKKHEHGRQGSDCSEPTNRYTVLSPKGHEMDSTTNDSLVISPCNYPKKSKSHLNREAESEPQIIDDSLGDAFEVRKVLQEMQDLLSKVNDVWEQAARDEIPIVVASFITHVSFAIFEDIDARLKVLCNGSCPDILRTKIAQIQNEDGNIPETSQFILTEKLDEVWHLLLEFTERHQAGAEAPPLLKCQQITVRVGPGSAEMDRECYVTMLENMRRYMRSFKQPPSIVLNGSPLYADIGYRLTHEECDFNSLRSSFGLQMLLETCKSFLLRSNCPHAPSVCRLRALQFAQEVAKSIGPVLADDSMPCRCCQTLAFHLEHFQLNVQTFVKERVFDLYFQNPWVCGSHMLEILEISFYYGLRLFSYRHFVGSVLHVYNVLRKLMDFEEIPLLERLCDLLGEIMFPGGRPDRNFKACCMRYMGGRLRFSGHANDHRSGCHKFEIPVQSAKATAGFGMRKEANDSRFQYRKISLLHHIKREDYHLDDTSWERVGQLNAHKHHMLETSKKRSSCHHHNPTQNHPFSTASQHNLCQVQAAVLTEFCGPFPAAKINPFEVYMSCVKIVSMISDGAHGDLDKGARCLCFLEAIVTAADRYNDNQYKLQPFGCKELVRNCKDAMTTVLGDRNLDDFLWKGL